MFEHLYEVTPEQVQIDMTYLRWESDYKMEFEYFVQ